MFAPIKGSELGLVAGSEGGLLRFLKLSRKASNEVVSISKQVRGVLKHSYMNMYKRRQLETKYWSFSLSSSFWLTAMYKQYGAQIIRSILLASQTNTATFLHASM